MNLRNVVQLAVVPPDMDAGEEEPLARFQLQDQRGTPQQPPLHLRVSDGCARRAILSEGFNNLGCVATWLMRNSPGGG